MFRRSFIAGAGGMWLCGAARAAPLAADPFALGVASGQPGPDSVILWTRLMAAGEPGERLGAPIAVDWSIAEDEAMQRVVGSGQALAEAQWAHSVHVEASGLRPGRPYWYRFTVRGMASPIGRTRTAPAERASLASLRFVFGSCQQYEQGYYAALRHLAQEDADLMIHLGDYIYELTGKPGLVRRRQGGWPTTVDDYRNLYTLYKSDRDLQTAHAAMPWIVTWDDHEVENDYMNDISPRERDAARFLARRAAAYQAYWEHMPLPVSMQPKGPSMPMYRRHRCGDLAEFHVLDDRQYRSHQACLAALPDDKIMRNCAERLDPGRTILGPAQEAWFADGMAHASTRWNVIAQQTLMAQLARGEHGEPDFWHDGWDGYAPARQRLLDAVAASPVRDTLVLSGDVHSFWAADLKRDFDAPDSATVGSEFVGGSITSQGEADSRVQIHVEHNPHIRYGRGGRNGYAVVTLDSKMARVAFRAVDDVQQPQSGISTLQSFTVEAGKPGVSLG